MPNLTNMKLPPPKPKTEAECAPCSYPREDYPYGLRLHLDTQQLEQLGIDKLPDVGSEVTIVAKAKVTTVNQGASEHDKKTFRNVGLQITDLGLQAPKSAKKTEDVFYNSEKGD
jgi:major coat protein